MIYDIVIIGGGLGGLQCGYILAKNGLNVCVLEKNPVLGGCLQSYRRRGAECTLEFDSGMHYVGGLDQGQPLNCLTTSICWSFLGQKWIPKDLMR